MKKENLAVSDWSFFQKMLFRLVFLIYVLVILVYRHGALPFTNSIYAIILKPLQFFVLWMGALLLNGKNVKQPLNTGSSDTTFNYIVLLGIVVAAVIGTIIWSVLDRNRPNYQKLLYFLSVLIRFYLGFFMFTYGLAKLFNMQFGELSEYRLKSTYGQSSPMGLAWTFFSYSTGYKYFIGLAEVIGGLLLLFRRTVALGAVITLTVTANIVAVNYFFDVPVKIVSTVLLSMSLFLILKDAKHFLNFFLLNKATEPINLGYFNGNKHSITFTIFKYGLIIYLLFPAYTSYSIHKNDFKIYGKYQVESINKTNIDNSDSIKWKKIDIKFDSVEVQLVNNKSLSFLCNIDQVDKKIILFSEGNNTLQYEFSYQQIEPDVIIMKAKDRFERELFSVKSKKTKPDSSPLMSRGFHWVNEYPYNR